MRRGSLTRDLAARAHETRRGDARRLLGLGAVGEAAAQPLLEGGQVREHQVARTLGVMPPHPLDQLLVRLLRRPARLVVPQVAERGYEQLAVRLDRRLEDLVARGA